MLLYLRSPLFIYFGVHGASVLWIWIKHVTQGLWIERQLIMGFYEDWLEFLIWSFWYASTDRVALSRWLLNRFLADTIPIKRERFISDTGNGWTVNKADGLVFNVATKWRWLFFFFMEEQREKNSEAYSQNQERKAKPLPRSTESSYAVLFSIHSSWWIDKWYIHVHIFALPGHVFSGRNDWGNLVFAWTFYSRRGIAWTQPITELFGMASSSWVPAVSVTLWLFFPSH